MARTVVVTAALCSVGVALTGKPDLLEYTFEKHLESHNKQYTAQERAFRAGVFEANLALIKEHNAKPHESWFAAPNQFSDWTDAEFKAYVKGSGRASLVGTQSAPSFGDVPASVDWRQTEGVMTAVKNQGQCGSCWAFSATETLESHFALATKQTAPVLGPQQLVSCMANPDKCGGSGGCQGATQPLAFAYTETTGLSLESSYPYSAETGTCDTSKIAPVVTNTGVVQLPTNNYTALIGAVATVGPVSISVAAGSWSSYGGGVYSGSCDYDMDHAVQLVGYGEDSGKLYWLVRNSWGSGWGESGYIRLERFGEGSEPCGTDSTPQDGTACAGDTTPVQYCGKCAILSASSYPTGVGAAPPTPTPPSPPSPSPSSYYWYWDSAKSVVV
jgi:cathepsin L